MMASMRNWLQDPDLTEEQRKKRTVVVHCKAGKGRSGTVSCSYLISEEGWKKEDALKRFTERRMRPNFGAGVSIPSQLRWVGYVERWAQTGKKYVERPVQVLEVHVWGLRDGVKVAVEGFVDEGRTIKNFHTFTKLDREIVREAGMKRNTGFADAVTEVMKMGTNNTNDKPVGTASSNPTDEKAMAETKKTTTKAPTDLSGDKNTGDVVFRPKTPIILPTSDINIDFERRNKAGYGMSMVTAVAHVWFNTFFEGGGPERKGEPLDSGVFEIEWDAMDGIKGSLRKGTRGFDKMAVVWKTVPDTSSRKNSVVINEPDVGEEVKQTGPADWRGAANTSPGAGARELGLRAETPHSRDHSRASSLVSDDKKSNGDPGSDTEGVKTFGLRESSSSESERGRGLLPTSKDLPGPAHQKTSANDGKALED